MRLGVVCRNPRGWWIFVLKTVLDCLVLKAYELYGF
jgi:hypothetical protein